MSGELPFIDIDGVEIANAYRTASYLQRGLGPMTLNVGSLGCAILGREVGGVAPFVSPSVDPAPWYDAAIPESAQFLGFVPRLDFQGIDVKRNTSQRFGSLGGGVIGIEQFAVRSLNVDGWLIANTCPGLEYGRHWLYSKLGNDCLGCALRTIRVRESCPPDDGTNDTRGERIMYDAALIDGVKRSDVPGQNCCEYEVLQFVLASQSPYLYSRVGTPTAATRFQTSGGIVPPSPAILDTGVRANAGPPPSASWTYPVVTGFSNNLKIVSNTIQVTAATNGIAYWNPATYGPDCVVMVDVTTRVTNTNLMLLARLTTPGTNTGTCNYLQINFGAPGSDSAIIGRILPTGAFNLVFGLTNQTFATGDKFMITCRGNMIEGWRLPSGGAWTRIAAYYDPTTPVAGNAGLEMADSGGGSSSLNNFAAGTLATPVIWPLDVQTLAIPAVSAGIVSPIVTVVSPNVNNPKTQLTTHGLRLQLKTGSVDCFQQDDFSVNNIATRWTANPGGGYTITGGKAKPAATGTTRRLFRDRDSAGVYLVYKGGKVQADIKLATTIANGSWGVELQQFVAPSTSVAGYGAFLVQSAGPGTNVFVLANDPNGGTVLDSVAFTPVANTTYRIIYEQFLSPDGSYEVRGYLVNPLTNQMLTRPLKGTTGTANPYGPNFGAGAISSLPRDVNEEWDNFYSIDYTDAADYIDVNMPGGTLVVDMSRRVTKFTAVGSQVSVDGSPYVGSPIDTPLGWIDLCAGQGAACLQYWGDDTAYGPSAGSSAATASIALQQRQR